MSSLRSIRMLRRAVRHQREGELGAVLARVARRRGRLIRNSNLFAELDVERSITRRFESRFRAATTGEVVAVANYAVAADIGLPSDAVVYSAGVGREISFDREIVRRFGCSVHLFDPTPSSAAFMADVSAKEPKLLFRPVGLWTDDVDQRFYLNPSGGSASAVLPQSCDGWFDAPCRTIRTLMSELGHDHVDLLKMDIEGAALPVLEQLCVSDLRPTQIVAELERPRGDVEAIARWIVRVAELADGMVAHGYDVIRLERSKRRYFSVELLFVRR